MVVVQLMAGLWDWREARRHAHWRSLPWLMLGPSSARRSARWGWRR
ncbi:MAG: hypothetical protein U1F37_11230 [Alphaproteobacteria bacterium]